MNPGALGDKAARRERAAAANTMPLRPPRVRLPADGSPPVLFVRQPRAKPLRAARGSALIGMMCTAPILIAVWLVWLEFTRVQSGLPAQVGPSAERAAASPILAAPPPEPRASGPVDSGAMAGAPIVAWAPDMSTGRDGAAPDVSPPRDASPVARANVAARAGAPPPDVSPPARADADGGPPPHSSPAARQTVPERATAERRAPPRQAAPQPPAAPGRLFISSRPWGRLLVDGRLVGNTPKADLPLSPGDHSVRIERDGYCPFEQPIHVTAGYHVRLVGIVLQECAP